MNKLVVVAHPDDETLFFSSVLDKDTKVICVTDANADGRGAERKKEFANACTSFGVQDFEMWDFKDIYEKRLPIKELVFRLEKSSFDQIYTHAPIGEYGHPHHQDVSRAVFEVYEDKKIWVPAYNAYPKRNEGLSEEQFKTKLKVLTEIYGKETSRFINLISATTTESFIQMDQSEVVNVYNYLTGVSAKLNSNTYTMSAEVFQAAYKDRDRLF